VRKAGLSIGNESLLRPDGARCAAPFSAHRDVAGDRQQQYPFLVERKRKPVVVVQNLHQPSLKATSPGNMPLLQKSLYTNEVQKSN
jgi:hypothetical protein